MSASAIWDAMDPVLEAPGRRADRGSGGADAPGEGSADRIGAPPPEAGDRLVGRLRRGAGLGGLLWVALLTRILDGGGQNGDVARLLLLAVLVLLPLGLALLAEAGGAEAIRFANPALGLVLPAAGWLVAASLLRPTGLGSGMLAAPWLGVAAWVLGAALWRSPARGWLEWRRGSGGPRVGGSGRPRLGGSGLAALLEIARLTALLFWLVGAAWLLASRLDLHLGYGPLIARLTAAHFHVAGFAATLLAWRMGLERVGGRRPAERGASVAVGLALLAVPLGMPLVAGGIMLGGRSGPARILELAGSGLLTIGLLALALQQALGIASRFDRPGASWLMRGSSASLVVSMPLAFAYAMRLPGLDIPRMLAWHARLNVLGFALCGLLAWTLEARASRPSTGRLPGSAAGHRAGARASDRKP
ncbi:MAG: YndJ family transporter [Chloroflexi bacterium]|nr:YndJ family transporter [Chloroflexota bacterium]